MRRFGVRTWTALVVVLATATMGLTALEATPSAAVDGVVPPIIGNTSIGLFDASVPIEVQQFEAAAIQKVLTGHGLPATDTNAVKGWARNEIAAQEWVDLARIISNPGTRTAQETAVFNWFRTKEQQRRIAEQQAAVDEFRRWSGMTEAQMAQPLPPDPRPESYCGYQPPGGATGPFKGTYSTAHDLNCRTGGCPVFTSCPTAYPSVEQFKQWGSYASVAQVVNTKAFRDRALGVAEAVSIGIGSVVAGVIGPMTLAIGAAAIGTITAEAALQWVSAALTVVRVAGALNIALTVITAAITIGIEIYKITANAKIPNTLIKDRNTAQTEVPDLTAEIAKTSGSQTLFALFLRQTLPDVDYGCTGTAVPGSPPCANAPAPVAQNTATDPRFIVTEQRATGTTVAVRPTIYTASPLNANTGLLTRASGGGWFVPTSYDLTKGTNLTTPSVPSVATGSDALLVEQRLHLAFTDWDGKAWTAERTRDLGGNEAFVISPMESVAGGTCASAVMNTTTTNCVTTSIAYKEPDGTKALAKIVPVSAVLPKVSAEVPPIVEGGATVRVTAAATSKLSPGPYTYRWQLNGGIGVTGQTVDLAFPSGPGLFPVTVTATDVNNSTIRASSTVLVQVMARTFVDVLTRPQIATVGEPVTFVARVDRIGCVEFDPINPAQNCARTMTGTVQFSVDGNPVGLPVPIGSGTCPDPALCVGGITTITHQYAILPPVKDLTRTSTAVVDANGAPVGQTFPAGSGHTVTATYSGDANFLGSTGGLTNNLGQPRPPLDVGWAMPTAVMDPPVYPGAGWDQPVTLSARVAPPAGSALTPTGDVRFSVNGTEVGSPAAVDAAGNATTTTTLTALKPGAAPYQFAARYSGDGSLFGASASVTSAPSAPTYGAIPEVTSLGGPIVVPFSRPVKGVTSKRVKLQRSDTDAFVSVKLVCTNAANVVVGCSAGPVSKVAMTPSSPLVPNLTYFVSVGMNDGTAPVMGGYPDAVPMVPDSTLLNAPPSADAFSPGVLYQWGAGKATAALGGSYRPERYPGATGSFTATGASIGIISFNRPDGGIATVKVTASDGTVVNRTIDTYAATPRDVTTTITGLPATGQHTVLISVPGTHSAASTGNWVRIDGTVSGGTTNASPALTPARWPNFPGAYSYTGSANATAKFSFSGAGFDWKALVGPNNGKVKVTVDGVVVTVAQDLYAPGYANQSFHVGGLVYGTHTVVITALGTKNAASSDVIATFRGFSVS